MLQYFSGSEISTDDRSYLMHLINAMDVHMTNVFFYPRLLPFVSGLWCSACFLSFNILPFSFLIWQAILVNVLM